MNESVKQYMLEDGWQFISESPLEIHHLDGSIATGFAAKIVMGEYEREMSIIEGYWD
jgi:hypothetical protein